MRDIFARARRDDGSTTMEYAMIVLVAVALAGLLLKAVTSPEVYSKLLSLIERSVS
jgi:Flp pilus assembly pilin Flp